ncbi:MAG: dockerin type I domain-containing protein, partial [Phycisphaerales bacterium]
LPPSPPATPASAVAISAGLEHAMAMLANGSFVAWGSDGFGQCIDSVDMAQPVRSATGFAHHVIGDAAGRIRCIGSNDSGQSSPPDIVGPRGVSAGVSHSAAITAEGLVVVWGSNAQEQHAVPKGVRDVRRIDCGGFHTLALRQSGEVVAWGYNAYGQCENPPLLRTALDISAGEHHSTAIDASGAPVAWGLDNEGQSSPPWQVTEVMRISAGAYHSAALRPDGSVACWGWNDYGQCTPPASLRPCVEIAAGYGHTVALTDLGTVVAWGDDAYGLVSRAVHLGAAASIDSAYFSGSIVPAECGNAPAQPDQCACGPIQLDANQDGVADCLSVRFGDFNLDGRIDAADLALLLSRWSTTDPPFGDLDRDGQVGATDLALLLGRWGSSV